MELINAFLGKRCCRDKTNDVAFVPRENLEKIWIRSDSSLFTCTKLCFLVSCENTQKIMIKLGQRWALHVRPRLRNISRIVNSNEPFSSTKFLFFGLISASLKWQYGNWLTAIYGYSEPFMFVNISRSNINIIIYLDNHKGNS